MHGCWHDNTKDRDRFPDRYLPDVLSRPRNPGHADGLINDPPSALCGHDECFLLTAVDVPFSRRFPDLARWAAREFYL